MGFIRKVISCIIIASSISLHLNAQETSVQTKNCETYWESLALSAGTGTVIGIIYGYVSRVAHKTSHNFFSNPIISWPVNQLVSLYFVWQQNKAIDIFHTHAHTHQKQLDGDVAKIIAFLHHLCITTIPHE